MFKVGNNVVLDFINEGIHYFINLWCPAFRRRSFSPVDRSLVRLSCFRIFIWKIKLQFEPSSPLSHFTNYITNVLLIFVWNESKTFLKNWTHRLADLRFWFVYYLFILTLLMWTRKISFTILKIKLILIVANIIRRYSYWDIM